MVTSPRRTWRAALLGTAVVLLLALRLPSLAQPAGADQSLYAYAGQQWIAGAAPYAAAWDQKPPGIHMLYGVLWWIWPDEAVIGAADLVAAALVAVLLIVIGRQLGAPPAGWLAAMIFLLLAHPSLQRLGGVFVRAQCETFIGALVTVGLALALSPRPHWWPRVSAGVCLGFAVWLKYNAVVYLFPLIVACALARHGSRPGGWRPYTLPLLAGVAGAGIAGILYLGAVGALTDLRLATFDYNFQYSGDTYAGPGSVVSYLLQLPVRHARYDLLWFLGGAGLLLALLRRPSRTAGALGTAWVGAAVLSIAINGARDLPQYFVQAAPALAWAAGAGFAGAWQARGAFRVAAAAVVLLGLWRVGIDAPIAGVRLGGLPGLVDNVRFDLDYLRGRMDRATYLSRFGGQRDQDKFIALDVERLGEHVRNTTPPEATILVFGFSPGVYLEAERESASRFFWSRPIVIGFAADQPGYGVSGLMQDLAARPPAIVALQKQDWGPGEPNSDAFFLATAPLADWLERHYRLEQEQRLYSVWRRIE